MQQPKSCSGVLQNPGPALISRAAPQRVSGPCGPPGLAAEQRPSLHSSSWDARASCPSHPVTSPCLTNQLSDQPTLPVHFSCLHGNGSKRVPLAAAGLLLAPSWRRTEPQTGGPIGPGAVLIGATAPLRGWKNLCRSRTRTRIFLFIIILTVIIFIMDPLRPLAVIGPSSIRSL